MDNWKYWVFDKDNRPYTVSGIVLLFVMLPVLMILVNRTQNLRSHAAAPDKLETEGGVLGGNAKPQADSSASGGQYVAFINSVQTPSPAPISSSSYDAVFSGDATGATDVTNALISFFQSNNGKRVALAPSGIYKVTSVGFTANNLTIDFRGARLAGSLAGAHGILRLSTSTNITLNDPYSVGTGYAWIADLPNDQDSHQNEHGIYVDGGSNIIINHPITKDTRGDGIYTGYQQGKNLPPTGVIINNPDIQRASRNGISPVSGEVTIIGGKIDHVGLFGVDFEANDAIGSESIKGVVRRVDIRHIGDLPTSYHWSGGYPYAIAAAGYVPGTPKPSMLIENCTGDFLRMTIRDTQDVRVRNNTSDTSAQIDFPNSTVNEFTNNIRITRI